jgi:hypothetical protein
MIFGLVQVSGRVRPFRQRQCLQHRHVTGLLQNDAGRRVYVAYDENAARFGDYPPGTGKRWRAWPCCA